MRKSLLLILIFQSLTGYAQIDYNKQYANGKDLFQQGKFNLAMETFKPLVAYDAKNRYSEYASFYYALSAYKLGYKSVARDMFTQLKTTYPKWDKLNEVNFWIGKIHFDNGNYFQGLKVMEAIADKSFEKDIQAAKQTALSKVTDVETLRMMNEEYPKDAIIARALVRQLSQDMASEDSRKQAEELIKEFDFKRDEFFPEAPTTYHKEQYAISVLLPFQVNLLDPTPAKKRNQIILDFYEGMKLAADTLNQSGPKINIYAYDTEQASAERVQKMLTAEELANTDLIVGPLFPEEFLIAEEFALTNSINIVHPFSNNSDLIGNNPHAYLFQPSAETLGRKAAEYLATTRRKNTMVFYGPNKKDSIMAANFIEVAAAKGLTIVHSQTIAPKESKKIIEILATPTEFDEFKYPSEFTLKKDSIGSIYVAADDPLIYSEVVGSVETRGDSIKVVGSENWIDDTAINPEKYQTLGIALLAPNYANKSASAYQLFFARFVNTYGRTPSKIAQIGYEFAMFFGNQLKTNGVFFQDALSKSSPLPGYITEGFNFQSAHNNQLVPVITFRKGELTLLDKK